MSHSYTILIVHCVFAAENRACMITPAIRERLFGYIAGIIRNHGGRLVRGNGTRDHVHLLIDLPPDRAVADMMRLVKANSSKWIHETFEDSRGFAWQSGYSAFSVSPLAVPSVVRYIDGQEAHHRTLTWEEEIAQLAARARPAGVDPDGDVSPPAGA